MPNKIIPSTKLRVVTVHKLKSLTCHRRYFWRWVLNLESRNLNINFWYGGVLGAGFEALISGRVTSKENPAKAMQIDDKKRCKRSVITGDLQDELRLQRRLIAAFINQAKNHPDVKKMKLKTRQEKFAVPLKDSGLLFCGTPDGEGTYANRPVLFECKTASKVTQSYIDALSFDKQVHGYAYSRRLCNKSVLPECCYCIFHKPQKRIKKGQTSDEFVTEITQDLKDRPSFYYTFHKFHLGRQTVAETGYDIEALAADLKAKYDRLRTTKAILDPHNWPKQEDKCYDYRGCEFLPLCKKPKQWHLYMRVYQQREMLYEQERKELAK
jgi:hypothetical protein